MEPDRSVGITGVSISAHTRLISANVKEKEKGFKEHTVETDGMIYMTFKGRLTVSVHRRHLNQ